MSFDYNSMMEDCLETGDLGMGMGLKPGAIPKGENESDRLQFTMLLHTPAGLRSRTSSINEPNHSTDKHSFKFADKLRFFRRRQSSGRSNKHGTEDQVKDLSSQYAEVPIGTSISQQRILFEQELQELMKKNGIGDADVFFGMKAECEEDYKNLDKATAEKKLHTVEQEVEILKNDLELCQKQLDTKYQAIRILQGQAYATQTEQMLTNQKVKILNRRLQQEINSLQFKLDHQQTTLSTNQQQWLDKLDRLQQENAALMATVEVQAEEVRKLNAEKMAVVRERDELLALLDVQERNRYESLKSQSSDDDYFNFSSTELATLGACRCRVESPEPCSCAFTAANYKKDIAKLKQKVTRQHADYTDLTVVSDTYRMAFEDQLARNRGLIRKIAELTHLPALGRVEKAKAAVKWLIKQLNDDDFPPPRPAPCSKHLPKSTASSPPSSSSSSKYASALDLTNSSQAGSAANQEAAVIEVSEDRSSPDTTKLSNSKSGLINNNSAPVLINSQSDALANHNSYNQGTLNNLCSSSKLDQVALDTSFESAESQHETLNDSFESLKEETNSVSGSTIQNGSCALCSSNLHHSQFKGQDQLTFNTWKSELDTIDSKTEMDLIDMLVDMICDKSEALAHQRLTTKMLANKTRELEEKLATLTEEVFK